MRKTLLASAFIKTDIDFYPRQTVILFLFSFFFIWLVQFKLFHEYFVEPRCVILSRVKVVWSPRCDDDTRQCVSLTSLTSLSLSVSNIRSHSNEESQEKRKHGKYMSSSLLKICDPPLVVFVMLFVYELLKWADMDREVGEITFSVTALSVYAVSCLFFMFLVASLYIIGLTPWRACLRYNNIIERTWRGLFIIFFLFVFRREGSSDNLDQAQEESIKWVIQRDNKRWENTDTELTT